MRELEYPMYPSAAGPRLRWSEIAAGAAVTLSLLAAFNFLGVGLGFVPTGAEILPVAPKAWWPVLVGALSFFTGAWFASRLSDSGGRSDGVIYGVVSWAAATLGMLVLPIDIFGGLLDAPASGVLVFASMIAHCLAAAAGGLAGARFYVPVPVAEYHRTRRHPAGVRG